uniref:APHAIRPPSG n=1 Tax=Stichopus japonicus TaxID=307972 RepID=A0A346TLN8_STIJA|nr:APHAIRPPSG precursor [Apostichopus japonicus]
MNLKVFMVLVLVSMMILFINAAPHAIRPPSGRSACDCGCAFTGGVGCCAPEDCIRG